MGKKCSWKIGTSESLAETGFHSFQSMEQGPFWFYHDWIRALEFELQQLSFGTGIDKCRQLQVEDELKVQRNRQEAIFRQKSKEGGLARQRQPKYKIFPLQPCLQKKKEHNFGSLK